MQTVTLAEAQARLPELIAGVRGGEEVLVVEEERAVAKKQPRQSLIKQSLIWRMTKWCGFSSPLVIVMAFAGRLLGIDTSWFLDAETSQGKALIQAISKAARLGLITL